MARLLFAAHDPGGALMIGAAAPELLSRGHEIEFMAAGPTADLWRQAGHVVRPLDQNDDPANVLDPSADGLVAGSGFGAFERRCWQWARGAGINSLAVIDSWTHFLRRFETPEGCDFPDVVGVIDESVAEALAAEAGRPVACAVVGQPHLQAQTERLVKARDGHDFDPARPTLVFFSEPILADFGVAQRGYDQYQVFEAVIGACAANVPPGTRFLVKPHPRETRSEWRDAIETGRAATGLAIDLAEASTETLLAECDGVLGMTSMVLLEAHLSGVATLSFQPGRTDIPNPAIEFAAEVVTDPHGMSAAVSTFMGRLGGRSTPHPRFQAALEDASKRFADAVEARVLC